MRKPVYAICEQQRWRSAWKAQISLRIRRFESYLVANPEDRFSHGEARIITKVAVDTKSRDRAASKAEQTNWATSRENLSSEFVTR